MIETTEKAIVAGGGFWGMQDLLRKRRGFISARVGYAGGHAEAIEIVCEPQPHSGERISGSRS